VLEEDERNKSMEPGWNDTNRENQNTQKKYLSQSHFVHQKSHTYWPRFYGEWMITNCLNHSRTYENDISCHTHPRKQSGTHISHCFVPYGNYIIDAKLPIKNVEDNSSPQY